MKDFILNYFIDSTFSPTKINAVDMLGALDIDDVLLSDSIWFVEAFPPNLKLGELVAAYEFLSKSVRLDSNVDT
jgi:hypothetical protein